MLRALSLALLMTIAAPSFTATAQKDGTVLAQQQQPSQQVPKRDCERKQEEGIS